VALIDLATAGALGAVSLATLACWAAAWRRRLRADGVLPATSRRQARRQARALHQRAHGAEAGAIPDPARVLDDLRTLLAALTADPAAGPGQAGDTAAAGETAAAGAASPTAGMARAVGPSGMSRAWPDIPGPRSAPEAGRVPRDCQPLPAGPDGGEPAAAPVTPEAAAEPVPATAEAAAEPVPATAEATAAVAPATAEADPAGTGRRDGLAALESMLAGAELLMVGCGEEEEAW
jgi:hypothetical protein